jgi:alpha-tubulin suppressor-like RCC1 family protein
MHITRPQSIVEGRQYQAGGGSLVGAPADNLVGEGIADTDGTAYAWGSNSYGQLGAGTAAKRSSTPVKVALPAGITATAIAGGGLHSLALGTDGAIYAWGYNKNGQLGDGSITNRSTPVKVTLPAGVTSTAIAAGSGYSLAAVTMSNTTPSH